MLCSALLLILFPYTTLFPSKRPKRHGHSFLIFPVGSDTDGLLVQKDLAYHIMSRRSCHGGVWIDGARRRVDFGSVRIWYGVSWFSSRSISLLSIQERRSTGL